LVSDNALSELKKKHEQEKAELESKQKEELKAEKAKPELAEQQKQRLDQIDALRQERDERLRKEYLSRDASLARENFTDTERAALTAAANQKAAIEAEK